MNLKQEIQQRQTAIAETEEALDIALNKPKYAPTRESFSPLAAVEDLLNQATTEADRQQRLEMLQASIAQKKQELAELQSKYDALQEALIPKIAELRKQAELLQSAQAEVLRLAIDIYQRGAALNAEAQALDGKEFYRERIEFNPGVFWSDLLGTDQVVLRYANLREIKELHEAGNGLLARIRVSTSPFA